MLPDDLRHSLLTHDQEIAISRRIQCGDAAALDELVTHNLRLVYQVAQHFYTTDPGTEPDDLIQHGMIGLLTAARKYDPDHGTRFSTYAHYWIRQAIQRAALTAGTIPRSATPSYQQVKPHSIRAHAIRQASIARLDAPLRDRRGDDSDNTLIDILADDSLSVEEQVFSNIEFERIFAALRLNERAQAIVRDWLSGVPRNEVQEMHGVSHTWFYATLHNRYKEKIMPYAKYQHCTEPGCTEPLYENDKGTIFPRCHEHQKKFWREAAKARSAADRGPLPASVSPKPPLPVGAHRDAPSEESAQFGRALEDGEKDQPTKVQVFPIRPEGEEQGAEGESCTCPDCIYREIVSLLAARNPRIAELVEAMQKARRLRDDLGI